MAKRKPQFFKNTKEDLNYIKEENYEFNDIFKKVCDYIGHKSRTDSYNLQQTALQFLGTKKFKGVFPYDVMPKIKRGESVILNTDSHDKPGEHWTSIYRKSNTQYYFFDSYGREWTNVIPSLKLRVLGNTCDIMSAMTVRQFGNQEYCGQMSLSWLIYLYNQPKPSMALVI